MKKFFTLAAIATLALVSCSKATPDTPATDVQQEISFQTAYYVGQTKADSHNHLEFDGTFKVRAYYTGDKTWAETDLANAVLHMQDVEISEQSDLWKATSGTYYWPKVGNLSFFGYAGWTANPSWGTAKGASYFSVTETIANASDPMVADFAFDLTNETVPTSATHFTAGVPMLFHHTAAKIAFKARTKTSDELGAGQGLKYVVVLNKVIVDDRMTTGTYTHNSEENKGAWTNATTATDLEYYNDATGMTLATTAAAVGTLGNVTVLPQTLVDGEGDPSLKALVDYTVKVFKTDDDVTTATPMAKKDFTGVIVPLSTTAFTSWEQNKIYTYTLVISPVDGEIFFDPAIVDWSAVDAGEIEI